jgi:hypothetical protein
VIGVCRRGDVRDVPGGMNIMELNSHHRNPVALVFTCPKCGAAPGDNCFGDRKGAEGRYQYHIHKARLLLLEMPKDREEYEERVAQVRAAVRRPS